MSDEVTLTVDEQRALAVAVALVESAAAFDIHTSVERIVAARVEQARREFYSEALVDALHPEFGTEWREPDGVIWQAAQQARADERERIAQAIEATYLGPDSGRGYDGSEAPDAHCRNAYDEGLYDAARIAREGGPS